MPPPSAKGVTDRPRVLLWVTTKRDAEITRRLFDEVGLDACSCESLSVLESELKRGAAAVLLTEEAISPSGLPGLIQLLEPRAFDLPTVLMTRGSTHSEVAASFFSALPNLTILERPAPVGSIVSAVQSAVRMNARQRETRLQLERIQELQLQLSLALSASELGTFHCKLPLGKLVWNTQCKAHFWLPEDAEVDIDRFYELLHPDDRNRTRAAVEECVQNGQKYDVEYRTVSPAGEIRWIRATGRTITDPAGNPVLFAGTTQNITSRKNLEDERNQLLASERAARVESDRANHLKDEFLATLSHELRTPLNAIVGWVELLKYESTNPEAVKEGIAVIERNVRAQTQLIDDLLDVSRIISGKVRLDVKPLDFSTIVAAAIETVQPAATAKGVKLETILAQKTPLVSGDAGRLQQMVWNLLTNSVKFTPRGGKVQVLLEKAGSSVKLSVADNGEGISADFLPHVFERFRQADGSASRNHGGLGLGLSIVKTLTEMHGGRITAESKGKGSGATFTLFLPLRIATVEQTSVASGGSLDSGIPFVVDRPDLSGLTILVVDDEADARGMMHRLLRTCKATSIEAPTADAALTCIDKFGPHLILSDIGMPGTDGYQFIREVRRKGVSTPAIALTAFARSEDRIRSIQAGFQAHLAKPIEPGELLTVVASLSGRIHPSTSSI